MKPVDVKLSTCIGFNKENNKKDPKFVFAKGYVPNWSQEVLWLRKWKILFRGHILLVIERVKKLLKCFTKKNCQKQIKQSFRVEKVIKRKGDTRSKKKKKKKKKIEVELD